MLNMQILRRGAWNSQRVVKTVLILVSLLSLIAYLHPLNFAFHSPDSTTFKLSRFNAFGGIRSKTASSDHDARTANRTLGFERVIAISLPERSDKRDAMALMAALSDIDVQWEDGVKADSIVEKALPFGVSPDRAKHNFLGSWRSHMNAIRRIVATGISSALIFEDDIDWDVHLKSQLWNISQGTRRLLGEDKLSPAPESPYGDGWDVLWLGHCGEVFPEMLDENQNVQGEARANLTSKYAILDDKTMPSYERVQQWVDWMAFAPHTRLVHFSGLPVCSFAYAITQSAAQKILYALSVDGLKTEFDNALAGLCRDGRSDSSVPLKCLSVNPTIMSHHKPKGRVVGDSDINGSGGEPGEREKGFTESIQWSMRLNLGNILKDRPLEPQFEF